MRERRLFTPFAFVINILLVYITYAICRAEYILENWNVFHDIIPNNELNNLLKGSWMFDTSAIIYTNILYALIMLIPLHYKEGKTWQGVAKWIFIIVNSICLSANLVDSVYFKYTGRRTTTTVFQEFKNENNISSIIGTEIINHWYLVLLGIILITGLILLYASPYKEKKYRWHIVSANSIAPHKTVNESTNKGWRYYLVHTLCFLAFIPIAICGMRGGATTAVRPITISNANQYVSNPSEAAAILNTPFSLIRTLGKTSFENPKYFSEKELEEIYSPIHNEAGSEVLDSCIIVRKDSINKKKNVVILIVESFGREYIGKYNECLEGGKYKGYAPFIDSLYSQSLSFDYTFCNGRKSIDGMPSILSSIPMFVEPFVLTPASMNNVSGIAGELGKDGYYTAFFHGAENGSMGFQAFAYSIGFKDYFGRTEYNKDKRFGGYKDFDGTWAIWDEPFLQFYATRMSEMKEPFMTAVFTASSHHPYVVPEKYKDVYPEEGNNVIHKCIRYTDHALKKFFEYAQKQSWYNNTLFVFTSDHTNLSDHAEYKTDLGEFGAPILFFDPSGEIKPQRRHAIAQQIDIMPTVLSYLGHDKPYIGFGKNLLATNDKDTWAINYNNGIYQYVKGDLLLQFDGTKVKAVYNIKNDWMLKKNIKGTLGSKEKEMERATKAIIQSYMTRMKENQLTIASGK